MRIAWIFPSVVWLWLPRERVFNELRHDGAMSEPSKFIFKSVLKVLHYSGLAKAMAPVARGRGVIFMLHRVGPVEDAGFSPNRILKVTPKFLEKVIALVKRSGFDVISLDDVPTRIKDKNNKRPFACFTLDDGYRDNIDHAYPVFKKHNVPFTIYLPTAFADGEGDLWWLVLQESILKAQSIKVIIDGAVRVFPTGTQQQKDAAFKEIYWWLRSQPESEARQIVKGIAKDAGYDATPLCSDLVMTWDQARKLGKDPLVTFGGHTCRHLALAKLPASEARYEITESIERLERELGRPCRHFAYPYGDAGSAGEREFDFVASLGLATAVTTRKGHIHAHHQAHMSALPRISLNGDYQDVRYVSVFLTGVPFALWNALGRVRSLLTRSKRPKAQSVKAGKLTA